MIARLLAWFGITPKPRRALPWHVTVHHGPYMSPATWTCGMCRSGSGAAPDESTAHMVAGIHHRAVHTNESRTA